MTHAWFHNAEQMYCSPNSPPPIYLHLELPICSVHLERLTGYSSGSPVLTATDDPHPPSPFIPWVSAQALSHERYTQEICREAADTQGKLYWISRGTKQLQPEFTQRITNITATEEYTHIGFHLSNNTRQCEHNLSCRVFLANISLWEKKKE